MLTSEYVVLGGAKSLALATQKGQSMTIQSSLSDSIQWTAQDIHGNTWFSGHFNDQGVVIEASDTETAERLSSLLKFIHQNKPQLIDSGLAINTSLEFDRSWGLGSSSTLVANLSKWSGLDGLSLLHAAFKGSGYDVAVGCHNAGGVYTISENSYEFDEVAWNPSFNNQLHFIHQGQKRDTAQAIKGFDRSELRESDIEWFSNCTNQIIDCTDILDFEMLMEEHEMRMSEILAEPTLKTSSFNDYHGLIKSLGAWGGDFFLATGSADDMNYFRKRGLDTIIPFNEMIRTK